MTIVLYKWAESWGLPSLSPACVQVETYLRYTHVPFEVRVCQTPSNSPTGALPAVENDPDVCGLNTIDDFASTKDILQFIQAKVKNLDEHLAPSQKAQLYAFTNLVETKLNPATMYSMWCENAGFKELKKAAFQGKLPFPLDHAISWNQRRLLWQKYGKLNADELFSGAAEVLNAVADIMRSSGGPYFFGDKPTSLDALLAPHLAFYRLSPCSAPALSAALNKHDVLSSVVHQLLANTFTTPIPTPPPTDDSAKASSWSDAAQGNKPKPKKVEPTAAENQYHRNSQLWLMGAGAAIAGYVVLSGRYVKVVQMSQEALSAAVSDDVDDEDEEEEDDEE